jgi:Fibronectin type III domain
VTLTWSPPSTGTAIYYEVITAPPDFRRINTSSTTLTATGLTNGTTYSFAVRAFNGSVYGTAARTTATPHVIPPGPPTNLAATSSGAGQITVSWTPPTSSGSSGIDHYTVTVSPGGISQRTSAATNTYVASNLADNVTYTFTITATNAEGGTGRGATVYAPLPLSASIGLQPTAGAAKASITVTGQLFLKNESITLYWDVPAHVAASVVTDGNGAFTIVVKPFAGDKPKVHKLCASVPPTPCANFTLQPPPSPSPSPVESPSPSSSPSNTPQASGARTGGGLSGLDIITRPPFVFLPIIGILGLLGVIAYWALSRRRRTYAPTSATVVHLATRPDYMAPFPTSAQPPAVPPAPAASPPATPQPPAVPSLQPPAQPPLPAAGPPPVQPRQPMAPPAAPTEQAPTNWPAAPDEPPDLPQPSD